MNDQITESIFLLHICIKDLFSEYTLNRSKKINRPWWKSRRITSSQPAGASEILSQNKSYKENWGYSSVPQQSPHMHKAWGFILSIAVIIAIVTAVKDKRPNEEIGRNLFISHSKYV